MHTSMQARLPRMSTGVAAEPPAGWRDGPLPLRLLALIEASGADPEADPPDVEQSSTEDGGESSRPSVNDGSFEDMGRIDGRSIDLDTMRPVYDGPSAERPRRPQPHAEWDAPSIA